ncbi:ribosome biogenesis GTP-binding protein YihA/YsxC [Ruminococcaceae bacterium OttesenSCG-928-O06]|nr:ribosome biogenesis GTP-binding protein YihA/YsxC [Ruminococcaceae bacterium OttesenSCG-928-O06]
MQVLDFIKAEFVAAYGIKTQLPASSMPEFVFAGRSNVGKSSLINKLCNRKKLARVSGTPGKTATINFYAAGECYLVDLPGYGYAKTSQAERRRWDELINGYFGQNRRIPLMLQLLDCRHAPSKDDIHMLEYLRHYHLPYIAVLTKADKVKPSQHARIQEEFTAVLQPYNCGDILLTSAEKGIGIEKLRDYLTNAAVEDEADGV